MAIDMLRTVCEKVARSPLEDPSAGSRVTGTARATRGGAVGTVDDTLEDDDYDEFGLLHENAEEWGLPYEGRPVVERGTFTRADGQALSYLRWGTEEPELVFLNGGAQNANTWDTVVLALGRPAVAIDLPGHGHSDRRADRDYGPWSNAEAVAEVIAAVAPQAVAVIGMSLGGATNIRLTATRPDLVRKAVLIDVTPQINDATRDLTTIERGSVSLIGGPPVWDTFEEMAQAAIALSPFRAASGVRRGARHNSRRLEDGRWTWRYDLFGPWPEDAPQWTDFASLWDDVEAITVPVLFVRGGESKFNRDEDVEQLQRRLPSVRVETVAGAGHAVQSDRPLDLVRLIQDFALSG
jgi:pimeloyl-ACP methyl ester carboxylesterase